MNVVRAAAECENSRPLIESLISEVCPACGKPKVARQTFCRKCYYTLSADQRKALYNRVGEGYEAAMVDAFNTLQPI